MPLDISARLDHATTSLFVVGEIDLATAPTLTAAITEALESDGIDTLIIDLAGVTFLDCTGIAALVRAADLAHKHGRACRWHGAKGMPDKVLRLSGLDSAPRDDSPQAT